MGLVDWALGIARSLATLESDGPLLKGTLIHIRNSLGSKGYWSTPYTIHYPPCVFVGSTFASHNCMVVLITIVSPTAIETLNRITDLLNGFVSSPKLYSAFPHNYAYLLYYYSHALIKELFGWTISRSTCIASYHLLSALLVHLRYVSIPYQIFLALLDPRRPIIVVASLFN